MMTLGKIIDILVASLAVFTGALNFKIMHPVVIALTVICLLGEILYRFSYKSRISIPRWVLNLLGIACIVITGYRFSWENPLPPLIDCVVILIVIKWIERKTARDYLQMITLSLFLLVMYTFYTFSMTFLLIISTVFLIGTLTLMLLTVFDNNRATIVVDSSTIKRCCVISCIQFLCALPLTLLLFFSLPRTSAPILAFLQKSSVAKTGFSDSISLGDVGTIQEDETVAFRAVMQELGNDKLYWRAVIFDRFDGRRWYAQKGSHREVGKIEIPKKESIVLQVILLEPHEAPYLVCLDTPRSVNIPRKRVFLDPEAWVFLLNMPVFSRIKYTCYSIPEGINHPISENLSAYLELPSGLSEDIRLLVNSLLVPDNPMGIVRNCVRWLQSSGIVYDMSNLPESDTPLQDFLFRTRRGNCEYFASALGVMLRMAGIPTRLVGGYRGGLYHPLGGYYLVLQKDAHVWVEAYLNGLGWIRLDPVPATGVIARARNDSGLWFNIRFYADILSYYWSQMVISYDVSKQMKLVMTMHARIIEMERLMERLKHINGKTLKRGDFPTVVFLVGSSIVLVIVTIAFVMKYTAEIRRPPHERFLKSFENYLKRYGVNRDNSKPLEKYIRALEGQAPDKVVDTARHFIDLYTRCLYGPYGFTREDLHELKALLRVLKSERTSKKNHDLEFL